MLQTPEHSTITAESFSEKLIGQSCHGALTTSGMLNGVQAQSRVHFPAA